MRYVMETPNKAKRRTLSILSLPNPARRTIVTTKSIIVAMTAMAEVPPRRPARMAIWFSLNPEQFAKGDIIRELVHKLPWTRSGCTHLTCCDEYH